MAEEKKGEKKAKVGETSPDLSLERRGAKPIFAWKSPDFVQYQRDNRWYVIVCAVAVVLAGLLAWQGIWTGVVLVIVAAVIFIISSRIKPKEIICAVYAEGVVVGGKAYEYGDFKSFWISTGELLKLKLQRTGRIAGQVEMPLQNIDANQIRLYISKHLPEEAEKGEDLVDMVNRILRF